uniref:Ubiquitin-like-conjugating enzyme ATG3 n=1 Tax=Ditylenchus dipsaci TaxID=166011 RepID=A0A915DAR6_9BILA
MNDLVNSFKSAALSVGEMLTPILKESKFKETGVLTPEEFVAASVYSGDHLVHHCPTWSWSKAGDPSKSKDYLPVNKQFLVTRHVPCTQRCGQMDYDSKLEKIIDEDKEKTESMEAKKMDNLIENPNQSADDDDDDDDAPPVDMDSFLESGALEDEDPNCYVTYHKEAKNDVQNGEEELLATRTYDLHITYDKYYQVPRFWLLGYDEQGKPLSVVQMKEDFSQEHADKTITMEPHPQVANLVLATIHPCRHAAVMKRLIEQFLDNGKDLSVLDYLYVFLKFVQAVIPTVEYDYTRSIQL